MMDSDAGIEVVGEASDGREAVELTEQLRPDVITMDILMPVMDGFQATKEIMNETPTRGTGGLLVSWSVRLASAFAFSNANLYY